MTQSRKILFVVNSDWFFVSHRLPIALEAIKRGYTVELATSDTGKRKEIESYGIVFHHIDFTPKRNIFSSIVLISKLISLYIEVKPDIIHHVTIIPTLFGSIATRIIPFKRTPLVINAISGLGYVFTDSKRYFLRFLVTILMRLAYKAKHIKFIFQNNVDASYFDQHGFLNAQNHILIKGSGVDAERYAYTAPVQKDKIRVLFSGRILADKGVNEFMEAARLLKSKWQGKAEFLLMGSIDDNNPSHLSAQAVQSKEIPGYLEWVGYRADMMQECILSDIVCLPSYREGIPKSLVEAMCVGRPIVTTDAPGCRDCVDEGVNGLIVPVRSIKELSEALDVLLSDEQKRLDMGKASRSKMLSEFTLQKVIEDTFNFYIGIRNDKKIVQEIGQKTLPKVTIVTVTLESKDLIRDAIESVVNQNYPNIEYLIIDGGSSQESLNIIHEYRHKITKIVSERDAGIYDAMNKGLSLATGDIIGFLNSDDFYNGLDVISKVVRTMEDGGFDAVYGDLDYVKLNSKHRIVRRWRSGPMKLDRFYKGWMPPHPTFFVRKSVYQQFGGFNQQLKHAADYELMLRLLFVYKVKAGFIPHVLVKMRLGGQSNRSLRNRLLANLEDKQAWEMNGIHPKWYTFILKPLLKVFQYRLY